ncbi:MAG TPA: AAA family ATPase [Candidatus Limnocylindrales bacterium]|nr:AAA family ATPase [Candidatus Limnocylindrales bacterium]
MYYAHHQGAWEGAGGAAFSFATVPRLVVEVDMRAQWHRLQNRARSSSSRRRLTVALLALVLVLVAGSAWVLMAATGNSNLSALPTAPAVEGRWTLGELQRQIEAGEVTSIDAAATDAGLRMLVANTGSGAFAVTATTSTADTASALVSLGYGDLLSEHALGLIDSRARVAGGDPLRPLVSIGFLFLLLVVAGLILFQMRANGTGPFGRRPARFSTIMPAASAGGARASNQAATTAAAQIASSAEVHLADVAGCDEAKLELAEAIEFLRDPAHFRSLGARVPRGILLYGPPGTGKTMLARAVATEANVPFHHASGSDFVEKYVGVGARRVRDLFEQARKMGSGVIFIDEFDALGKARGGNNSHEEREQTLNQLLVELDGFGTAEDLVVIAATNRLDVLDEAVLRPGRFSRKVHVGLPDVSGREAILAVHARNKPLADDVSLEQVARKTYGFSGAQLADLLNEAAILAARRKAERISNEDIHGGWLKVAVGTGRRRSMNERERAIIAAHEVGHAICGRIHGDNRRVEEISLFAHGDALGVTVSSQEDNDLPAESDLRARLVALMGGRAAEELLFQEVTPGAASDFEKATHIATMMVTRWGMGRDPQQKTDGPSGRGNLSFFTARRDGSMPGELQAAATRASAHILDQAYAEALRTLIDNVELLRRIAAYLVRNERIDGDTFDALFDGRIEVPEADSEWRPAAARPRDWSAITARRKADPTSAPAAAASGAGGGSPAPVVIADPPPGFVPPTIGGGPLAPGQAPAASAPAEL